MRCTATVAVRTLAWSTSLWGARCPICNQPKRKCWCPSFGKPYPCLEHG